MVSPRARWVKTVATELAGQEAISTRPAAMGAGRARARATAKASPGSSTAWASRPRKNARGCRTTRRRSSTVSVVPMANITTTTHAGSRTWVTGLSTVIERGLLPLDLGLGRLQVHAHPLLDPAPDLAHEHAGEQARRRIDARAVEVHQVEAGAGGVGS